MAAEARRNVTNDQLNSAAANLPRTVRFLRDVLGVDQAFEVEDLRRATKGFTRVIARGGSGVVLRAALRKTRGEGEEEEEELAVKRVSSSAALAHARRFVPGAEALLTPLFSRQFLTEVLTCDRIARQLAGRGDATLTQEEEDALRWHTVGFRGLCCADEDILVVFDYHANGTLASRLEAGEPLSLQQRVRIAHGVAAGLYALHRCSIAHLDVTATNILLGADLTPKICDFGLAKTPFSSSSHHMGTPGYTAPELPLLRGQPGVPPEDASWQMVDVFAFGVVLLQLLTRHAAYHAGVPGAAPFCLHEHVVERVWQGEREGLPMDDIVQECIETLVDPALLPQAPFGVLAHLFLVAWLCIHHHPTSRLTLPQVLDEFSRYT